MTSTEKLLQQADALLAKVERCRAEVFFEIGRWMAAWKAARGYKTIAAAGIDASKFLRPRGHSFDPGYYYAAHEAATKFAEVEQRVCIEHAVPVSGIRALLRMPAAERRQWLNDICDRKVLPPYRIRAGNAVVQPREGSAGGHLDPADRRPIVDITLYGDEPVEQLQCALEALVSYLLRRRGLPAAQMFQEAMGRLKEKT